MAQSDIQRLADAKDANVFIFDSGRRLHAYSRRLHQMFCGIKQEGEAWEQPSGEVWNGCPERRCANCDCLGPNAVLAR